MKRKHYVLDLFNGVDDRYILEAAGYRESTPVVSRRMRLVLIAAVIALAAVLMGCGIVYALKMQDIKLGDREVAGKAWDYKTETVVPGTINEDIFTLSGAKGTPGYEAAKEWYDFLEENDLDKKNINGPAEGYYHIPILNSQEMVDKMEAICGEYDLNPVGAPVKAKSNRCLLEYLGIKNVLLPDAPADAPLRYISEAEYYDSGFFSIWFDIQMHSGENVWPHQSKIGFFYTPKDCFTGQLIHLNGYDGEERHYTTKSGHDVLILGMTKQFETWAVCDAGDATIGLCLQRFHVGVAVQEDGTEKFSETYSTDEQLNQILDTINFDLKLTPGDPAALEWKKP